MNDEKKAAIVIGTALLGSAALAYLLGQLQPQLITIEPRGGGSSPYVPPPPDGREPVPVPSGPVQLVSEPLTLETGGRYLASIALSGFFVRQLANEGRVREQAERQGFRDVVVTRGPRPPLQTSDYQIEGTYVGAPRTIGRSQGNGAVWIVDAWRIG